MALSGADIATENKQIRLAQVALIGIVTLLVLTIIGVPLNARLKADRALGTATSNLTASGRALLMYSEDWGGFEHGLPTPLVAGRLFAGTACDPEDSWRKNCAATAPEPMLGSFAYVKGVHYLQEEKNWRTELEANPIPTLLIDPFRSRDQIHYFKGDEPSGGYGNQMLPLDLLRFRADGSIASRIRPETNESYPFKWPTAFWVDDKTRNVPVEVRAWGPTVPPPLPAMVKTKKGV
jgi:hypothetical protein